jgi:hypothetical protein
MVARSKTWLSPALRAYDPRSIQTDLLSELDIEDVYMVLPGVPGVPVFPSQGTKRRRLQYQRAPYAVRVSLVL